MGLIQTGFMLDFGGRAVKRVGNFELLYGCDGCEGRTGNPYARLAKVVLAPVRGRIVDDRDARGWTFFHDEPGKPCTRAYCAVCSGDRGDIRG